VRDQRSGSGRRIVRNASAKLLNDPGAGGCFGQIAVKDGPSGYSEMTKKQYSTRRSAVAGEEIHCGDGLKMIAQKAAIALPVRTSSVPFTSPAPDYAKRCGAERICMAGAMLSAADLPGGIGPNYRFTSAPESGRFFCVIPSSAKPVREEWLVELHHSFASVSDFSSSA